jgi:hypothetical protein
MVVDAPIEVNAIGTRAIRGFAKDTRARGKGGTRNRCHTGKLRNLAKLPPRMVGGYNGRIT